MTDEQRDEVIKYRKSNKLQWHGPPNVSEKNWYHVSAACYDHLPLIGASEKRMVEFEQKLISEITPNCHRIAAWCILPNHYHILVKTPEIEAVKKALGHVHGHTSFEWNKDDRVTGRKCWHRCLPKQIKSHAHRMATMNYIHNNPVHHSYANCWQMWPFSSAQYFLDSVGRVQAIRMWLDYPVDGLGENWDASEL